MILSAALRLFRHHRLYAAAFAGTLALAVAAATASIAVVRRAFIDPLPYPDSDRLITLYTSIEGQASAVSPHVLTELEAAAPPLEGFVGIRPEGYTYSGDGSTDQLAGVRVPASFFSALGATPAAGRFFRDGESDAVVVSYGFWQRALGGSPDAIGRSIVLDGTARVVVGILPPDFVTPFFAAAEIVTPLDLTALMANNPRARRNLTVVARRAPGASAEQVDAFLATFSARVQQTYPELHGQQSWVAKPLRAELIGTTAPALYGVAAAAALLVLIVSANIAGLSAARALGAQRETAVRAALGAGRGHLIREQLVESLLLAVAGAGLGVWLGRGVLGAVRTFQSDFLFRLAPLAFDGTTAAIGIAIGAGCGILAALIATAAGASGNRGRLVQSSRGTTGTSGQGRLRAGLVVVQVGLALVLIVGAGLLIRTVSTLAGTSLGIAADGVTTTFVNLPGASYADRARQIQFEREVVEGLAGIPGVVSATASVGFPVIGGTMAGLAIDGRPTDAGMTEIAYLSLAPNFLESLGIPVTAGRGLAPTDVGEAPGVVVINETMARTYWPAGDAVGARVRIGPSNTGPWITVVGVVADLRQHGPLEPVRPTAFGSTWQYSWPRRHFAVRTAGPVANLGAEIRRVLRAVDPAVAVGPLQSVDAMVARQTAPHRLVMMTLSFFGLIATLLSGLGLYAVVALTSRMRRREYAVRMALGAGAPGVRWLVLRQALILGAVGVGAGLGLAWAGTRILAGLLRGVEPMDAGAVAAAATTMLAVTVASAWLPAREAARLEPANVLKAE